MLLPEFENAENESGKCPKEILVNGFERFHCDNSVSISVRSSSVGCPKRLVGPRKPTDIVLSKPTKRCLRSAVWTTVKSIEGEEGMKRFCNHYVHHQNVKNKLANEKVDPKFRIQECKFICCFHYLC